MIDSLQFMKVKPNAILISSQVGVFYKNLITRPGNTSAIGVRMSWIIALKYWRLSKFIFQ